MLQLHVHPEFLGAAPRDSQNVLYYLSNDTLLWRLKQKRIYNYRELCPRDPKVFILYTGSDGYRYPSTDTVSVKMTKIVSVSVSALKFFCICIRIRIRPEIFLYPYPYPFFNFFVFVSVSVSVINSKFILIFFGARFIK